MINKIYTSPTYYTIKNGYESFLNINAMIENIY